MISWQQICSFKILCTSCSLKVWLASEIYKDFDCDVLVLTWEHNVWKLLNKITYRCKIKSVSKQRSKSECVSELTESFQGNLKNNLTYHRVVFSWPWSTLVIYCQKSDLLQFLCKLWKGSDAKNQSLLFRQSRKWWFMIEANSSHWWTILWGLKL